MLARIRSKLMLVALVGTAWVASYASCDTGSLYTTFGGYVPGYYETTYYDPGYYDTNFSGYILTDPGYYPDPYVGDYYDEIIGDQPIVY